MSTAINLHALLDLARWAPSGDNVQSWRFEIAGENHVVVHGHDTRDHCVYDLDGHASELSLGALLETMAIAASDQGLAMQAQRRVEAPTGQLVFDVRFAADASVVRDPLLDSIRSRSVQRRPMSLRPLTPQQKRVLEAAAAPCRVRWMESTGERLRMARLLSAFAKVRLTMPEAYPVHRDIIEWNARFSEDRVPDQALGVDRVTLRLMRYVLGSWTRVRFLNTYLAGTVAPRIQMDVIPGLACAAHFVLVAPQAPRTIDDHVASGRVVQRFWLALTAQGLAMQPAYTPLVFSRFLQEQRAFSAAPRVVAAAAKAVRRLEALLGGDTVHHAVFMGRLGTGPAVHSRSVRRPLQQLLRR